MGHTLLRISEPVKHILKQQCLGYLRLNAQFECIERDEYSQMLWEFSAAQIPFCMYRNLQHDAHQVAMLWIENALHLQNTITFDFNFQHHPNPIRILAIGSREGIEVYHFDISETESYAQCASSTWELLDRLPVGILVADLHTHQYVFLNQHLEKILGYSKQEIVGKTLDFLHLADELNEVNKDFAQQIAGKIQYSRPFHFVKKNKETLQASVVQIHTEIEGKPYAIGVLKKRKWVFDLLHKGYHQLNGDQVLSAFPHSVLVFERAGYLVQHHIKPHDTSIQALPIQIGAHFSELFPEAITMQLTDRFEMMNVQPQAMEWELQLTHQKDPTIYKVKLFPISEKHISFILIDISEQELQKSLLLQSEKQFKDIFTLNEAVMFMYDPESLQMLDVNDAALRFYGYNRQTFLTFKLSDIKESNSELEHDIALILTKTKNHFTFKHRMADGKIKEVEVYATTLEVKGKPIVCSIIQDITERQSYLHTIVEQNRLIRDIAWTHAHQLRAPISKLQALIEHLSESDEQPYIATQRIQQELMGISRQIDATLSLLAEKTSSIEDVATQIPDFTKNPKSKIRKCEALVIDDDNIMLTLHSHLLKKSGLFDHPKLFNSGETALDYLSKNDIPWLHFVVFLDLNMPELSGWDFIHQARKRLRNAQLYVVIVSSSIDPYEKEMAKSYEEVIDFISKPLQMRHMDQLRQLPVMQRLLPHV